MPATPHDAKGLLIASIRDDSPVVFIEHRQLFERVGPVPEGACEVPLGEAAVLRQGTDVTIVAASLMVFEALRAGELLSERGISAEIIDLRTLSPMDDEAVFESVRRTRHLIVADTAWRTCGIGSEIAARVAESVFGYLEAPVRRIASPDAPAPASSVLERLFYPGTNDIVDAAIEIVGGECAVPAARANRTTGRVDEVFRGPF
jgi:pyruvate dehydrogenase E1 component beta subunit